MEEKTDLTGTLVIKDRKSVTLNNVKNVIGFVEGYVSLITELGKLIIEGRELKIESLNKDGGIIMISGNIDGAYFTEERVKKGVFSGLFK